jgi:hypothetical protein
MTCDFGIQPVPITPQFTRQLLQPGPFRLPLSFALALPTPYAILGLNYAALGRKSEALAAAKKGVETARPATMPGTAESGLARSGITAFTFVDNELDPAAALAQVEARFGMNDEALAIVQTHAAAGRWRRNYLLLNPDWAILRKDPRFRAIAEKAPL